MKSIALFTSFILFLSSSCLNKQEITTMTTFSSSSTTVMKNGDTKTVSDYDEGHLKKIGDNEAEIRKYHHEAEKHNDNPTLVEREASTNVKREQKFLGKGDTIKITDDKLEKVYIIIK